MHILRLLPLDACPPPGTTLVSIGHRPSLAAFHDRRLTVRRDGDGIGELAAAR